VPEPPGAHRVYPACLGIVLPLLSIFKEVVEKDLY
jgi:hypothetical protein